jgi:hypothetical protein
MIGISGHPAALSTTRAEFASRVAMELLFYPHSNFFNCIKIIGEGNSFLTA